MPFIELLTNVKVETQSEQTLTHAFGKAIEKVPGKSEQWLMVHIEGGASLYFAGKDSPCALLTVKLYGNVPDDGVCDSLSEELTELAAHELAIAPDRIYIEYETTRQWAWRGKHFGR